MIESSADDYNDWRCSSTIDARAALLKEARETIIEAKKKYEIAQKTGELTWD